MGKRLIILNQQPHVPSFMLAAVTAAKGYYDEIFYVNPRCPDNTDAVGREARVHFLHPSAVRRAFSCLCALLSLFHPVVFSDLVQCVKERKKLSRLLPQLLAGQRIHHRIAPVARRLVRHATDMSEVVLFSVWLDACAYTAAALKRRFPMVKAVSLAHAYEVLAARNPYIPYRHICFKHRYLDAVFFISHAVMGNYFSEMGDRVAPYREKCHVCHLGTYRDDDRRNHVDESLFNICTCSWAVPLKRLDILMDALKEWHHGKIRWTHIGGGPLLEKYRQDALQVMADNPLVDILFLGRIPNGSVKRFYAEHPIDLFLNLSSSEGLPVSVMEAVSYGIPVIATDVGGMSEIVCTETGFLLQHEVTSLAVREALCRYRELPPAFRTRLRASASDYWASHFDARHNMADLFERIAALNAS